MKQYRIKQIEDNKFIVTEQDAPGKHFKQKYYNRGQFFVTVEDAQADIDCAKKYAAMTEDELFACMPF